MPSVKELRKRRAKKRRRRRIWRRRRDHRKARIAALKSERTRTRTKIERVEAKIEAGREAEAKHADSWTADEREAHDTEQERLADRWEYLVGVEERLTERIKRKKSLLAEARHRVKRLGRKIRRLSKRIRSRRNFASRHFAYSEFDCREGGPVPDYMKPHLRHLANLFLEPLRAKFGPAHINSGHRWSWYNRRIGGASRSYHVYEDRRRQPAADVTFARGTPIQWAAEARRIANRHQLGGVGQYSSFVHVDSGPRRDWRG